MSTFVYDSYDTGARTLSAKMRRDIVNFVFGDVLEAMAERGIAE